MSEEKNANQSNSSVDRVQTTPKIDAGTKTNTGSQSPSLKDTLNEWRSPGRLFRFISWILFIFLGVLILFYFLYANDPTLYTLFIFGGFGGILYDLSDIDISAVSKKDKEEENQPSLMSRFEGIIQLPSVKRNSKGEITQMRMGWISHALFGIAGAFVVFLIVPLDEGAAVVWERNTLGIWEATWDIKILAFALVGGYGGRALLPTLAEGYLKRATQEVVEQTEQQIKEVKETVQQATATAQKIAEEKETGLHQIIEARDELAASTLAIIREHLEPDSSENPETITKIKESLPKVTAIARESAYNIARDYRHDRWEQGVKGDPEGFRLIARVIPIFEGLIDADTDKRFPGNYGQLAYALRDKMPAEYVEAIATFDKAIEIRDKSKDANHSPLYNIMRAVTHVALEHEKNGLQVQSSEVFVKQVLDDLRRGRDIATLENNTTAIELSKGIGVTKDVERLANWFKINAIDPETLTPQSAG